MLASVAKTEPPAGPIWAVPFWGVPWGVAITVTWAAPLLPSTVAVIVAVPGTIAVTSPSSEMLAMVKAPLVQLTGLPGSVAPAEFFTVAASRMVSP